MNDHAELATTAGSRLPLNLRFPARAATLKEVRRSVRGALEGAKCGTEVAGDIVIAVDEACQNIIRHAYGGDSDQEIDLSIRIENGTVIVCLEDDAEAIDSARIEPRSLDDLRPGGLGTYFMREIMDSIDYDTRPSGQGNVLTMRKQIG